MSTKLDPTEKKALQRILKSTVFIKVMEEALSEIGEELDATNNLTTERAANAFLMESGARGILRKFFVAGEIRERTIIKPRKLKH